MRWMIISPAWLRAHPSVRKIMMPAIMLRRLFLPTKNMAFLKSMMERIAEGWIVLDLPEYQGKFEISVHSHLAHRVMLEGAYEPEYARIAAQYADPNRDAIDVGANVGFYTVLFGKCLNKSRRVLSIEGSPAAFAMLQGNIERNGLSETVVARQVLAAAKEGPNALFVCVGQEEYSSAGEGVVDLDREGTGMAPGVSLQRVSVPGRTIDSLCEELSLDPGFIKIDVEGYEHEVIRGCERTIRKSKPVLLVEFAPPSLVACGSSVDELLGALRDFGYKLSDAKDPAARLGSYFNGYVLAVPTD